MDGMRIRYILAAGVILVGGGLLMRTGRPPANDGLAPPVPLLALDASRPSPWGAPATPGKLGPPHASAKRPENGQAAPPPIVAQAGIPDAWIHLPETEAPCRGWIVFYRHGCSNRFFTAPPIRELAAELGLGLVQFLPGEQVPEPGVTGPELLSRLEEIAMQRGRPELARAPLVLVGQSGAFNWGMSLAAQHSDRILSVIGFRTGAWPTKRYSPGPFQDIPVLVLAGEHDEPHRIADTLRLAEWAYDEQLPVTVLHQRGGHHASPEVAEEGLPVILDWLRAVVPAIPHTATSQETASRFDRRDERWGDFETLAVHSDRAQHDSGQVAAWLPDAAFAETWTRESVPVASDRIPSDIQESRRQRMKLAALARPIDWGTSPVWPCWRGVQADARVGGGSPLTRWSESEGILWKVPLIGLGHSSPVVVNDRAAITAADEEERVHLLCFDARDGALLWDRVLAQGDLGEKHARNSFASATVACDGERFLTAYVHQGSLWIEALDWEGNPDWKQCVGPFATTHGYGASPTLYGGLVIVSGDQQPEGTLAAFDRQTGELIWKVARSGAPSCGSPVVARLAGRDQLLLGGDRRTIAYDPLTGRTLWECAGPSRLVCNSIAFDDRRIFISGGHPEEKLLAIRADGRGDVTATHIEWELDKGTTYVPSPLVVGDRLLLVNDLGVAIWMRSDSGDVLWKKRLGGRFSSSPILVGDRVYATNEAGKTFVIAASDEYELMAENELSGEVLATPAIVGDRIYLRTMTDLYCLGRASPLTAEAGSSAER